MSGCIRDRILQNIHMVQTPFSGNCPKTAVCLQRKQLFCSARSRGYIVNLRPRKKALAMPGRSVRLTTLFLGRLRPPKRLTNSQCPYFRQYLVKPILIQWKRGNERRNNFIPSISSEACGKTGYRTRYLQLLS